jgi:hypothetical protein
MSGLSTEPRSVRGDDQYQDLELKDLDPEFARPAPLDSGAGAAGKYDGVPPPRRRGVIGTLERGMDLLVRYGVEERGIQPRPEEVRGLPLGQRRLLRRSKTITTRCIRCDLSRPAKRDATCFQIADRVSCSLLPADYGCCRNENA